MKMEDYQKYYIQGSDHYLIPTDVLEDLIEKINEWKDEAHNLGGVDEYNKCLLREQEEFILYLRHLSNWYSADGVKQGMVNEISQKYKEIIAEGKE